VRAQDRCCACSPAQHRCQPVHHARFALDEFDQAYDVFGRAAETGALKVVLSRTP